MRKLFSSGNGKAEGKPGGGVVITSHNRKAFEMVNDVLRQTLGERAAFDAPPKQPEGMFAIIIRVFRPRLSRLANWPPIPRHRKKRGRASA